MVERFPRYKSQSTYKKITLQTTLLCHPGLSGSPPKRVAVWWGDLTGTQSSRNNQPTSKQTPPDNIPCHPGLLGSPPKRVAVWWGDLTRDPVF
jgi:hypothetical protein